MEIESTQNLETFRKNVKRAGPNFLNEMFTSYRTAGEYILSADDCMKIRNSLGLRIEIIYLLSIANGLKDIDEEGFIKLLNLDKLISKGMRPKSDKFISDKFIFDSFGKVYDFLKEQDINSAFFELGKINQYFKSINNEENI